ncbi:hypothetical protein E5288_WYG005130 [Bos mutus]|uniref:TraB domain-containing protein n=1 Tax=Bos mutus TaxID=72004 RepID=A0A6B0S862_9CETA|nr:hypothetical protein [Bos mutus]
MKLKRRRERPNLPHTVTELVAEDGSRVYVVGTAHFSDDSKRDVVKTIREVQPDVVVVELCQYRVSMLKMDERTLLREAKEISLEKLQQAIRQNGVASGLMQMLLLKVSAHITEQLGVAPGGEFREAFKEDDVERCKQKDLLEQMMAEMVGEFPDLHRTIVSERDVYLTYMLRQAARRLELPRASDGRAERLIPPRWPLPVLCSDKRPTDFGASSARDTLVFTACPAGLPALRRSRPRRNADRAVGLPPTQLAPRMPTYSEHLGPALL